MEPIHLVRHIQLKAYEQMLKVSWRTNALAYLSGVSVKILFLDWHREGGVRRSKCQVDPGRGVQSNPGDDVIKLFSSLVSYEDFKNL
jgi:hypothetical protein